MSRWTAAVSSAPAPDTCWHRRDDPVTRRLSSPPVIVGAVAVLMAVFDLGAVVFATNDEARFPLLARDILTRGAVWFPQLNGLVYQNKPLLLACMIALASWPVGRVRPLAA